MKSFREELWFETRSRRDYINITPQVEDCVRRSAIKEGFCLVNTMHITASVYINDAESGLLQDYDGWLEKLAPHEPVSHYRHNRTGEDNGDAHLKRQVMGRDVNSMAVGENGSWLRSSGNEIVIFCRRIRFSVQSSVRMNRRWKDDRCWKIGQICRSSHV